MLKFKTMLSEASDKDHADSMAKVFKELGLDDKKFAAINNILKKYGAKIEIGPWGGIRIDDPKGKFSTFGTDLLVGIGDYRGKLAIHTASSDMALADFEKQYSLMKTILLAIKKIAPKMIA